MTILRVVTMPFFLLFILVSGVRAEEAVLSCDNNLRWGFIGIVGETAMIALEGAHRTKQEINTSELIEYGPPDTYGNVRRLKSKITTRACGPFVIQFSSGWFNANPLGEMGEPVFSVIEISKDGERILGPIALGSCSSVGLVWNRCPENWATSMRMGWDDKKTKGYFDLHRTYDERLEWP